MSLENPSLPTLPVSKPQEQFEIAAMLNEYWQQGQDGYLTIQHASVTWWIYCHRGEIIYITHSVEPSDRIDGQLRRLSQTIPAITAEVRTQVRHSLETFSASHPLQEYKTISKLVDQSILDEFTVQHLYQQLTQEALEFLWLVRQASSKVQITDFDLPYSIPLDLQQLLNNSKTCINNWQKFSPLISSPYQRPYLMPQSPALQRLPQAQQDNLGKILRGYSFRQLGILLKQDELSLVQKLFPLIQEKAIVLRDPQPPFDQLPNWKWLTQPQPIAPVENGAASVQPLPGGEAYFETKTVATKLHKIVCVDDSPSILQTMERFLGKNNFNLITIDNSLNALLEIVRFHPDLILMDVGMPRLDGYELSRLIRRHSQFRTTPIIMVTGNTGLIDRAKAKISGATDYMTKPFTQDALLKIVDRHLS